MHNIDINWIKARRELVNVKISCGVYMRFQMPDYNSYMKFFGENLSACETHNFFNPQFVYTKLFISGHSNHRLIKRKKLCIAGFLIEVIKNLIDRVGV